MPSPQFAKKHTPQSPEYIRALRESENLSTQEAAKLCTVSHSTWNKWESGEDTMPTPAFRLFKILIKHPELADI